MIDRVVGSATMTTTVLRLEKAENTLLTMPMRTNVHPVEGGCRSPAERMTMRTTIVRSVGDLPDSTTRTKTKITTIDHVAADVPAAEAAVLAESEAEP